MATTSRLPCHGKHYRCLPVALYSYTLFALALVALPAGASSRLALSILPPNWQQGKVDTSLQSELTNGLPLGLGVVPIDTADAEGKAGRTLATEPARRTNPVDADSETNSESEGCQESRGVPPPAEQQILQRVEEDECSEDCGGVRTESQANLHPAAQPWWGRVAGAPTMAEFKFEGELASRCANHRERVPMAMMPLSLPSNVYQQMIMSKATCIGQAYGQPAIVKEREAWEDVCSMVPDRMTDVMPQDSKFKSCAIVGNSGNLLKTKWGTEIDRHEIVMRFNDAPTRGFEKYVGSKTDYRVMNKNRFQVFSHDGYSGHGQGVKEIPHDKHATVLVSHTKPELMAPNMHSALLVTQLHNLDVNVTALSNYVHDHAYQVMGAFAKCLDIRSNGKVKRESKITSGVKTVLAALHMCESVGVYGMGDTSLPDKDIPYQYFTQDGQWSGRLEVSTHHNLSLEADFLHALARSDLIRHCRYKGCQGSSRAL